MGLLGEIVSSGVRPRPHRRSSEACDANDLPKSPLGGEEYSVAGAGRGLAFGLPHFAVALGAVGHSYSPGGRVQSRTEVTRRPSGNCMIMLYTPGLICLLLSITALPLLGTYSSCGSASHSAKDFGIWSLLKEWRRLDFALSSVPSRRLTLLPQAEISRICASPNTTPLELRQRVIELGNGGEV